MDINAFNSVSSNVAATYTKTTNKDGSVTESLELSSSKSETTSVGFSDVAATYEKSSDTLDSVTSKSTTDRSSIIQMLKDDQEKLKNNLFEIVRQSIAGQGNAFALASDDDYWKFLASGKVSATAEQIAQAKEDISDDGYWGVDKTSSRIVDFAITLSGNDTSKAETLIEAFKEGYSQATSSWGQDLPDISSQTYDAVLEKFEAWKNGTYESES